MTLMETIAANIADARTIGYLDYLLDKPCTFTQPELIAAWKEGYNDTKKENQ